MLVILGRSGSGKDTVVKELIKRGYKKILVCTTRAKRPNEVNGRAYQFLSEHEFAENIKKNMFAEYSSYITKEGIWYYGSLKDDIVSADSKTVIILNPKGYKRVKEFIGDNIISVFLHADYKVIVDRLYKRGDEKGEVIRRMQSDNIDFYNIENEADFIVKNNGDRPVSVVVDELLERMERK